MSVVTKSLPVSARFRQVAWRPRRLTVVVVVGVLGATAASVYAHRWVTSRELPSVAPIDVAALPTAPRAVTVTLTTREWTKVRTVVPVHALRSRRDLWRRMHFSDWDRLPRQLRNAGLSAMLREYRPMLTRRAWPSLSAADWDAVPQPMRALAFLRMVHHWTLERQVGVEFGLEPADVALTIGAIVMAESWFEHRAVNENPFGNRDLGLAQCSDHCRRGIAAMAAEGRIPFEPAEEDYFEPLIATRVAVVWFERELHAAAGDVPLAIRAYHRGITNAMDDRGDTYLANVQRLRARYIRTQSASSSWRYLTRQIES